ncbi:MULTISPECIES: DUF1631 family protein [Thiorhodovibrio]|uniref:DUF1631 family protein n=1 Tax=Thiorhodovibrio TaxID=61593 RepID=UPI001A926388|nr:MULTISPECIES: DUF1631 family protein [Thiorhodovibrio]MBK5968723.1 hypothetical protein [Thiorhodovibrio winogradskyi]WPL10921.1 hypothetical protein Thiosp_00642 [Thiorhodovibrio litoralis]
MLRSKSRATLDKARVREAIDGYRACTLKFCDQRLVALFESAGPSLLGFAEVVGNELAQSLFFATAAQLDEAQQAISQRFHAAIDNGMAHFFTHGRAEPRPWLPRREIIGSDEREIQTVASDNEALAIKNLIIRTNAHCFPELYALSQRLAAISGGGKLRDDEIPAGPHHLAHGFRAAIAEEEFDIRVKVVLYALFHHRVTWSAATLYRELNDLLRNAGILPKTRPVNLRRTAYQSTQIGASANGSPDPDDQDAVYQALVGDLLELAASQPGLNPSSSEPSASAAERPQEISRAPEEQSPLQSFLSTVAHSVVGSQTAPLPPGGRSDQIAIGGLNKASMNARDPELINTIERMFAEMFDTPGLPMIAKAALGQLQIPYLKAAISDIGLLRDPGHPGRLLLDECVEAGSLWIDESDPRQGALPVLREVVERILDTPDGEPPPFEPLLDHLRRQIRPLQQLRTSPERRSRDFHRERSAARDAQKQARGAMLELLRPYEVPQQVRVFLDTTWTELLTLVRQHRDEGPDSPSWREALDTARSLVEVFDPRVTGAALRARIGELPRLRQRIANGAQRLGSHNRASLIVLDNLLANPHGVREQLRRGQALPSRPPAGRPLGLSTLPQTHFDGSPGAEDSNLQPASAEVPEDALQAMIEELRKTKSGTWFELDSPFGDAEADGRRIQLSWISPLTSTYLFVDEAGTKTEMRGLKDLAKAMLSGRARVVAPPEDARSTTDRRSEVKPAVS